MTDEVPGEIARGDIRVLLVAGVPAAATLVARLTDGGFRPQACRVETPGELEDALRDGTFDVAICEDGLPDVETSSVLRRIRETAPSLPVIIASSTFGETVGAAAMNAGADDFLPHGSLARLVPAVEREIRTARMRARWQEASRSLRDVEARADAFLDNSPAVAFMKDSERRYVYVNRRWEEVFGIPSDRICGQTDVDWLAGDVAEAIIANDRAVLESGRPLRFEETVPAADGPHDWLVFKFPFEESTGARFVGGVAVDITDRKRIEDRLRATVEMHHDVIEHGQVLLCTHDLEGRILAMNETAEKSLGYGGGLDPVREGFRIQDILDPEALGKFDRYLTTIRETGTASGTMVVRTRTGERRYWDYRNTLSIGLGDQPVVRGLAFDITDRVRASEQLRDARRFSEEIIASAGRGVIVYDANLRCRVWNPFMESLTGVSRDEALGRTLREILPDVATDGVWELLERALGGEEVSSPDFQFAHRGTGDERWASSTFSPHRDSRGRIIGVIGIVEDVTARRKADQTLRESQAFIQKAQEVGHIGSWVSGIGPGATIVLSDEACRIFGAASGQLWSLRGFLSIVHPDDVEAVVEAGRAALRGDSYMIDHRIVVDGSVRWVHERGDVVRDSDRNPLRMVGIAQDITERKRLEAQVLHSQKMEAVGRLAGGVAHDFNNLLTAILGYSDLLVSQLPPGHPMRPDLEEIQNAGERAAVLTRQLLAFSRRQMLEPKSIDLNALVADLGNMLRRVIGEDVELSTRLDPDLGPVRADPTQIDQVILNLAVNARDAMPHGGRLTLETRNARVDTPLNSGGMAIDPGLYSVLEVSDTGTGIDAAVRERMFEPFFTTKEKGKGTGLGLATAYGIIRQTGGDIACESEPGRGTTFSIYLPRASQPAVSSHRVGDRGSRARTGAARTILLVEDEGGVRRLSRKLLESAGYAVLEASGADEALRILQNRPEPIHLLLTDVVMPGSNGPALARRLVGRRPEIRVLYMSGHTDAALEDLRPDATVIRKPFTAETLLSTVRSTLEDEATGNGTLGSAP